MKSIKRRQFIKATTGLTIATVVGLSALRDARGVDVPVRSRYYIVKS